MAENKNKKKTSPNYYKAQFFRTTRNKLRRSLAREKKFARLAAKRASRGASSDMAALQ